MLPLDIYIHILYIQFFRCGLEKLFPIHLIFRFFFYLLLEGVFLVFLTFNILIFCYKCFNFCPWFGWSVIYFNCCCCISAAYDTIRDDKAEIKNELLSDHATKIVWLTTMLFTLLFSSLLIVKKEKHSWQTSENCSNFRQGTNIWLKYYYR